jgi:hypothetical protein
MPTYNSLIDRTDAAPLIPTQEAAEILRIVPQSSVALSVCRTMRMSTKTLTQPVLGSFPVAYWVNGDTGLKQTTDLGWTGLSMTAEELATIVVIPDNLIADSGYPLWAEVRPLLAEAIALALDQAVFSGINKPPTWPTGIIPAAIAAGNVAEQGTATAAAGGVAGDLVSAMEAVEDDGYDVTRFVATRQLRSALRKARDTSGQRLLDVATGSVEGVPVEYVGFGVFPATARAIAGDFSMAIVGVRQDLTWKMLDQAVITDDAGKVIVNLRSKTRRRCASSLGSASKSRRLRRIRPTRRRSRSPSYRTRRKRMSVPDPLRPTVDDVASLIRARTKNDQGREVGTFDDSTRPTAAQVETHITNAVSLLASRWPVVLDESFAPAVRALTAYRAAMQIEKSYFPEQVRSDRSAYDQLREEYQDDLAALMDALGAGGEDGGSARGSRAHSELTPTFLSVVSGYWDDYWPEPENPANWAQPLQPPREPPLPEDLPVGDEPASGSELP